MKYLITCILTALLVTTYSQEETVNAYDQEGRKHGRWVVFFPEKDVVRYSGNFNHGTPEGKFVYNYQNDKTKAVSYFSENAKIQRSTLYHKQTGKVLAHGKYLQAITKEGSITYVKDSVWSFYAPNGQIISKETLLNGDKNGLVTVYYENGSVSSETNWINGRQEGKYKEYYLNGNVKEEGEIKDQNFIGTKVMYFSNGKIMTKGRYTAGVKHGFWLVYDENGKVKKYYYKHGKLLENEQEIQKFIEYLKTRKG